MKKWIIVCVLAAVFLVGANSFAPQLAEVGLSQALSAKFNLQNDDVRVQASPGAKIFSRRYRRGYRSCHEFYGRRFEVRQF